MAYPISIAKKSLPLALALLLFGQLLAACTAAGPTGGAAQDGQDPHYEVTLLVAAAASLEYAYTGELFPMFTGLYPWITVKGTYDSSGKLETQIREGLGADVFMSAATAPMNALAKEGLVDAGTVVDLLENEIVLIVPAGAGGGIRGFADLAGLENVALGDPESVPAGQYAKEALASLGIYDTVAATASFGTNVTEVLSWVAEASAPAGIVYATDAATTDKVAVVATAPEGSLETPVVYPVGTLAASAHPDEAGLFVEFLQSPEALAVFEGYGFKAVA